MILYYIVLYYINIILYYVILYYISPTPIGRCRVLYINILYYIILYYIIFIILYYIIIWYTNGTLMQNKHKKSCDQNDGRGPHDNPHKYAVERSLTGPPRATVWISGVICF